MPGTTQPWLGAITAHPAMTMAAILFPATFLLFFFFFFFFFFWWGKNYFINSGDKKLNFAA